MSVLIKDMEIPETCDHCPFHVYHSHYEYVCKATPMLYPMNLANSKGIRKDWCPLSEVPEPCEDKLKEIADALSEKMGYMNTCPNERDIILSYLGHKRSNKNHCNTDCWNEKCENYNCETKQQPEQAIKDCRSCKYGKYNDHYDTCFCYNKEDCSDWDKWESAQPELDTALYSDGFNDGYVQGKKDAQPEQRSFSCGQENDQISRQVAIDALWKALYDYEDKTEKQFQESNELDVADWITHRVFVQNMSDIDRQVIMDLPAVTPKQRRQHSGKKATNELR